jgi:hypothetical protein
MKRYGHIGLSCLLVIGAAASVSGQAAAGGAQTKPGAEKPATAKPATDKPVTAKPAAASEPAPSGTTSLGSVRIPRAVKANGENLPAGTYTVRITEATASPAAAGQTPQYERWAEFVQGGKVVAREVVTIVPAADIKQVADMAPPPAGGSRTEVLKGGDYLRLWVNRGGNHYLIHFNI